MGQPARSGSTRVRWTGRTSSRAAVSAWDCGHHIVPVADRPGGQPTTDWASAQPPHASVGYSLGGPPPLSCPYTVGRRWALATVLWWTGPAAKLGGDGQAGPVHHKTVASAHRRPTV